MIAVAFFAVWSLVGNILAGIIIFFTEPFKINDQIEILPENIKGKVIAINTFFTLLHDEEHNIINIPNSMIFQKFVKKIKRKKA
jgi:small-conductance mechanosensitive channel